MTALAAVEVDVPQISGQLLGRYEPRSDEWHEARRHGIGSSDIAAILGLSAWESRFSLYWRKIGTLPPDADSPETEWGRRLEPVVAGKFLDEHPEWHRAAVSGGTFAHPECGWQRANPDVVLYAPPVAGLPVQHGLLECKTAWSTDEWGPSGSDEIPPGYVAQVRWQLGVLGLQQGHLAVLIGGSDYREYLVEQDDDDLAFMRGRAAAFWRMVRERRQPAIDEHDATYQAIKELHPDIDGSDVELPRSLAVRYGQAVRSEARAKARKQKATAAVAQHMGMGRRATYDGQPIALRVPGRPGSPPHVRPHPTLQRSTSP